MLPLKRNQVKQYIFKISGHMMQQSQRIFTMGADLDARHMSGHVNLSQKMALCLFESVLTPSFCFLKIIVPTLLPLHSRRCLQDPLRKKEH
jgi:hypothetical protein